MLWKCYFWLEVQFAFLCLGIAVDFLGLNTLIDKCKLRSWRDMKKKRFKLLGGVFLLKVWAHKSWISCMSGK